MKKLGLAKQVRAQKMEECQRLSEILLDAEAKIGDLLKKLPKRSGRKSKYVVQELLPQEKTKREMLIELGFNKTQANYFEMLAENPDVIEELKVEARKNKEILSREKILRRIRIQKRQDKSKKEEQFKNKEEEEQFFLYKITLRPLQKI